MAFEPRVTKRSTRALPIILTDDEVRVRGIDLANANKSYGDITDEKREANREFKERLDTVNAEIFKLKDVVRSGVEVRDVEVEVVLDRRIGSVTVTRLDTGDVVEQRAMSPAEAQGRFDFDPKDADAPEAL